jgi:hypothetical protein
MGLNDLYILKTQEVLTSLRASSAGYAAPPQTHMDSLNSAVLKLGLKKDEHLIGGV